MIASYQVMHLRELVHIYQDCVGYFTGRQAGDKVHGDFLQWSIWYGEGFQGSVGGMVGGLGWSASAAVPHELGLHTKTLA